MARSSSGRTTYKSGRKFLAVFFNPGYSLGFYLFFLYATYCIYTNRGIAELGLASRLGREDVSSNLTTPTNYSKVFFIPLL